MAAKKNTDDGSVRLERMKPCPFCGGDRLEIHINPLLESYILCIRCHAKVWREYVTAEDVKTENTILKYLAYKWNSRTEVKKNDSA